MKKVFIHVGMHKTATTTMQKQYFPFLQKKLENITVNEAKVYKYLEACWKFDNYSKNAEFDKIKSHLISLENDYLFISMEAFCGNLFNGYRDENYLEKLQHLKELFAEYELEVIFAFRQTKSWIISCYKESIKEHNLESFRDFIANFELDEKSQPVVKANKIPVLCSELNIKLKTFSFEEILKDDLIIANYLIQETDNKLNFLNTLPKHIKNKGYSFEVISFKILLKKLFPWFLPSPIQFKGQNSIYEIEKKWNNHIILRNIKRLGFILWRGRWFRWLMIKIDGSLFINNLCAVGGRKIEKEISSFFNTSDR